MSTFILIAYLFVMFSAMVYAVYRYFNDPKVRQHLAFENKRNFIRNQCVFYDESNALLLIHDDTEVNDEANKRVQEILDGTGLEFKKRNCYWHKGLCWQFVHRMGLVQASSSNGWFVFATPYELNSTKDNVQLTGARIVNVNGEFLNDRFLVMADADNFAKIKEIYTDTFMVGFEDESDENDTENDFRDNTLNNLKNH